MPSELALICDDITDSSTVVDPSSPLHHQPLLRLLRLRRLLAECATTDLRQEHLALVEEQVANAVERLDHPDRAPVEAQRLYSDAQRLRHVRESTAGGAL